jgi:uncharacterized protein (TIGR02722 family)
MKISIRAKRYLVLAGLVALPAACAQPVATTMIDPRADRSAIGMGLDARDFDSTAAKLVQDMLESGAVNHPGGGRYVLVISRITNDTMQRIDTDQLIKRIRVQLLNSGKVTTTTAMRVGGADAEDPMSMQSRNLRDSREFNQANVAGAGQMIAPEISLTGKLLQNNARLGDGSQRVDYDFQLTLTQLNTGLTLWEKDELISKQGSGRTVAW